MGVRLCFQSIFILGIEGKQGNWDREETVYYRKSIKLMAWGNEGIMINNNPFYKDPRKWGLGLCHLFVKLRDHF